MHNEMILITEAFSDGESWLVIHPVYADGTLGNYIGYTLLHDGENNNIRIPIDIRRTTPKLMAMLHINASKADFPQYPGEDIPLTVNGVMVAPTFQIQGNRPGDFFLTTSGGGTGQQRLTDAYGMSLYRNKNDPSNKRTCKDDCLGSFRPLVITGVFSVGARGGASADKVGTIPLPDGTRQLTYDGAPLYYNLKDEKQTDVNGDGVGGVWSLVTP